MLKTPLPGKDMIFSKKSIQKTVSKFDAFSTYGLENLKETNNTCLK